MYIRIKKLREKNKLSKQEIADYLNISVELYYAYETGKKEVPVQVLSELSKKYNTSIDYIIGNTDMFIPHKKTNS